MCPRLKQWEIPFLWHLQVGKLRKLSQKLSATSLHFPPSWTKCTKWFGAIWLAAGDINKTTCIQQWRPSTAFDLIQQNRLNFKMDRSKPGDKIGVLVVQAGGKAYIIVSSLSCIITWHVQYLLSKLSQIEHWEVLSFYKWSRKLLGHTSCWVINRAHEGGSECRASARNFV